MHVVVFVCPAVPTESSTQHAPVLAVLLAPLFLLTQLKYSPFPPEGSATSSDFGFLGNTFKLMGLVYWFGARRDWRWLKTGATHRTVRTVQKYTKKSWNLYPKAVEKWKWCFSFNCHYQEKHLWPAFSILMIDLRKDIGFELLLQTKIKPFCNLFFQQIDAFMGNIFVHWSQMTRANLYCYTKSLQSKIIKHSS